VLIFPDGKAIYESHYILEFLESKYPERIPLLPKSPDKIDAALFAKQVQVVADGICDAMVLLFFEAQREEGRRSEQWMARQKRKINGGLKALADWLAERETPHFLVDDIFSIADIAAGSCLGYLKVRFPEHPWRAAFPDLDRYSQRLEERPSFRDTVPKPQTFSEKVV
jgi:glutathione S-transferase